MIGCTNRVTSTMMLMPPRKKRQGIPPDVAARTLFYSDRTCCVCRQKGKPDQIHHIDENPSNNDLPNLSVLCFDCHRDTQIKGGFDRKLDADQIVLYRDDWLRIVVTDRAAAEARREMGDVGRSLDVELVTSVAEIYRENKQYELLAAHYNIVGNVELRDKYVELALQNDPSDSTVFYLRAHLQRRPDLIPKDLVERHLAKYEERDDAEQHARASIDVGRRVEAAVQYIRGINESLQQQRWFSAAYYLREFFDHKLIEDLLRLAYQEATRENSLWWQIRALQELGWQSELDSLLKDHEAEIIESGNPLTNELLAKAKGDLPKVKELRKEIARSTRIGRYEPKKSGA